MLTSLNQKHPSDPAERKRFLARVLLGRLGTPEDVGRLAIVLMTEDTGFITGSSICVDGGLLAMR